MSHGGGGGGSKRPHTKSRHGCGQCKKRRVKCNQQLPICGHCLRRGESCDYLEMHADEKVMFCPPHSNGARSSKTVPFPEKHHHQVQVRNHKQQQQQQPHIRLEYPMTDPLTSDYPEALKSRGPELIPWLLETFWLHPARSKVMDAWVQDLGHLVHSYPYLKQSMFCMCALEQLSRLEKQQQQQQERHPKPPTPYASSSHEAVLDAAWWHNCKSIQLFRQEYEANARNWLAMALFSAATVIFQLAAPSHRTELLCGGGAGGPRPADYAGCLVVMRHLRDSAHFAKELERFYERSPMKLFIEVFRPSLDVFPPDQETLAAVRRLQFVRFPEGTSEMVRKCCSEAIVYLGQWAFYIGGLPRAWAHVIVWPYKLTDNFFALLDSRHPVAMLTLVYWLAVIHKAPKRWYLDGWARGAAESAMLELGPGWDDLLEWPRRMLEREPGGQWDEILREMEIGRQTVVSPSGSSGSSAGNVKRGLKAV